LVSELISEAYRRGITKLFLFTKAGNEMLFRGAGFYTVVSTNEVCFMENTRNGFDRWLSRLPRYDGTVGAAVVNCNPFTFGHRYLLKTAAEAVDHLDIFVVSEDRSAFRFEDRLEMVKRGTADIANAAVCPSGDYMISAATFPTYFMKDEASAESANARLDLTLFAEKIAPALNITKRFVGTEPYCPVTNRYNELMKEVLPAHGIEVVELQRMGGVSASFVRKALERKDLEAVRRLVPATTLDLILERYV
jgi:[citrate (pro-3S)-lyase] ligase